MAKKSARQLEIEKNGSIVHEGFRISLRENPGGSVAYQVYFGVRGGGQARKQYPDLPTAMEAAERRRIQITNEGTEAVKLTDIERADTVRALRLLEGRATLEEVAREWVRRNPKAEDSVSVKQLVHQCVSWMEKTPKKLSSRRGGGYSPLSVTNMDRKLALMVDAFGGEPAANLTAEPGCRAPRSGRWAPDRARVCRGRSRTGPRRGRGRGCFCPSPLSTHL